MRSVAWDPEGQFLVAVTASGLLQVWDLNNGFKLVHTKKQAAPKVINLVLLMRAAVLPMKARGAQDLVGPWGRLKWYQAKSHQDHLGRHAELVQTLAGHMLQLGLSQTTSAVC